MAKSSKATRRKESKPQAHPHRRRMLRIAAALILAGAMALVWVSLLTHNADDWPASQSYPPAKYHNSAGAVGAAISHTMLYWLGAGSYMGVLFVSIAAVLLLLGSTIRELAFRIVGVVLLTAATSTAAWMRTPYEPGDLLIGSGGVLGKGLGELVQRHFGDFSWVIVVVTLLVGLVLAAESLIVKLPRLGARLWSRREKLGKLAESIRASAARPERQPTPSNVTSTPRAVAAGRPEPKQAAKRVSIEQLNGKREPAPENEAKTPPAQQAEPVKASERLKSLLGAKTKPEKPKPTPAKPKKKPAAADERDVALPDASLLIEPEGGYIETQQQQVLLKRQILQQTLDDFGVEARVVGHMTGPVITMFELSLAPGVKVSQIGSLSNDIARALAAPGVRIVSPIPGKDTIGIEAPNADKETVRMKELMDIAHGAESKMNLPLYLGKDAGGEAIVADLGAMPHMLIAGTTGSGKSVCINSIIMSILMTRTPQQARLILIDPKMVEMAAFERCPHLLCPIVNDMRKAESILEWAATKMDERYELLKDAQVRNIVGYNRLKPEELYERLGAETDEDKADVLLQMPYYVIIVDELADLIMTSSKEVENHIIRIAQKARAVGIHLILATQRPSVNVVTGLIKSNMPCRVSFRVASRQESRIVLDQNGAEVLLGQGDMLFLQPGTSNLSRAQGTYIDDSEIRGVMQHWQSAGEQNFNDELVSIKPAGMDDAGPGGEKDDMFDQAVEIVLQTQRGSVSLLQRRLGVGYSRASRIVDQMAEAGILGDYKGSQARECMMTLEDWQTLKASIEADQSGDNSINGEATSS